MESYITSAWNLFSNLVQWCSSHTILTIGGINITFLGLGIGILVFCIISYAIDVIFFGG